MKDEEPPDPAQAHLAADLVREAEQGGALAGSEGTSDVFPPSRSRSERISAQPLRGS